ncbi:MULTISPECIES: PAS and ANTAR domain-containing protein [unclassified Mycolicibacterium]|uniref:PAS and ANTAR domain-containing protein n=1 Tax=unclassified Mycolicibacterium TaxID=2636767 RepID=UPI002EDAE88D
MAHTEGFELESATGGDDRPAGDVDKAVLGGPPQRVGRFEYRYDTDTWTWSEAVARIHGYEPGEVQPTTELMLRHKHPDDVAHVKILLTQAEAPFSSRHRIYTTTGEIRKVVVVGEAVRDASARIVATRGLYVDVTDAVEEELQREVGDELRTIVADRAVIEQAKGMLMLAYAIDAGAAFHLLRWRSQEANIKVRDIAREVVSKVPGLLDLPPSERGRIDHFLMTLADAAD